MTNFAKSIIGEPVEEQEQEQPSAAPVITARELIDTLAEAEAMEEASFASGTKPKAPGVPKGGSFGKSVQKKSKGTVSKSAGGTV